MELSGFDNGGITPFAPFNLTPMEVDPLDILSNKNLKSDTNISPLEKSIKKLKNDIHDFSTKDWDQINEDIKKNGNHKTPEQNKEYDYSSIIKSIDDLRKNMKKVHREYLSTEQRLVNTFNKNRQFNSKVSDFSDFLENYNEKEHNIEELKTNLLDLVNKNNDDNDLRKKISEFVDKRDEFTKLLKASRVIQELQTIPCCPMCLCAPLDSFVNPCGHTGCKECLIKSIQSNSNTNMNLNCPICRNSISCISPLYML